MSTITITVDDSVEKTFRKVAKTKYGTRKGYLGNAMTEAMRIWLKAENGSVRKALNLLEKGHNGGGLRYKAREELHER